MKSSSIPPIGTRVEDNQGVRYRVVSADRRAVVLRVNIPSMLKFFREDGCTIDQLAEYNKDLLLDPHVIETVDGFGYRYRAIRKS